MAFLFLTFRKMGPKPRAPHTAPPAQDERDITFDIDTAEFPPEPDDEAGIVFDQDTTAFVPLDDDLPPPKTVRTNPSLPLDLQVAVLREHLLHAASPQIQANDTSEVRQLIGETVAEHVQTPATPPEVEQWLALPHHLHGQPTGQTIGEFIARSDHEPTHAPNEPLELRQGTVFYIHRGRVHVNTRATQDATPIAVLYEGQFFGEIVAVGGQATAFLTAQPDKDKALPVILAIELSQKNLRRHIIELNALNAIHEARQSV